MNKVMGMKIKLVVERVVFLLVFSVLSLQSGTRADPKIVCSSSLNHGSRISRAQLRKILELGDRQVLLRDLDLPTPFCTGVWVGEPVMVFPMESDPRTSVVIYFEGGVYKGFGFAWPEKHSLQIS